MANALFIVRFLLQIVFALAAAAIAFVTIKAPAGQLASNLAFIAFCIFIILLLGPWWPSADKVAKWKPKLSAARRELAGPLGWALPGTYALFQAWDTYAHPNQEFHRVELVIAANFGAAGVAWMWAAIGLVFFWGAWRLHKRLRAPDKNEA